MFIYTESKNMHCTSNKSISAAIWMAINFLFEMYTFEKHVIYSVLHPPFPCFKNKHWHIDEVWRKHSYTNFHQCGQMLASLCVFSLKLSKRQVFFLKISIKSWKLIWSSLSLGHRTVSKAYKGTLNHQLRLIVQSLLLL